MKKIIWLFIVSFLLVNDTFSQNYNWITPNKTYLKLYINDDGIYRINKSDFSNTGINASNINPRTIKVLYNGTQIPIYFQGEDDGVFNDNDFFDFYGERNYGGITPYRDGISNAIMYTTKEFYDLYSDTSIYWIEWDGTDGQRMSRSTYHSSINYSGNYSLEKVHFEKDEFYYLGETINSNSDFRYFSNERVVGESWFWKSLTTEQILSDAAPINDLLVSSQPCSLKVLIYPVSFTAQVFDEHRIEIKINNTTFDTLVTNNLRKIDTTIIFPSSLLINNSNNSITLHYIPIGFEFFRPTIHIDFFELVYPRELKFKNNISKFNLLDADSTSKKINISGYNSANQLNIYDIINKIRIENFSNNLNILTFTGKSNSKFEIINDNISKKPFRIISRQVSNLTSMTNGADYLIVYNKLFESQAEQLRNHRENFDNLRAAKAEMQDIYDIFNYGIEDPVAVRNFVKYSYDNWQTPKLKYVCLFGRSSLDPKRSSSSSQFYHNLVPTYGNPSTDGYFVNFNIGTFTYYHQISVGRLPIYTVTEAQDIVDKLIRYDLQPPDKWWKKFTFITGGPDRAQQINFQAKSENLINNYISPRPISGQVSRIYRNDSTGYITYNYKDSIKREFDRGAMIVNFIGHAASQDWEIGLEDPNTLNNGLKLPLVLSFTCFTGKSSEPDFRGFGENFLKIANKCAIGFIGSTGWSFSGVGDQYNEVMLKGFADSLRRIGDIISYASKRFSQDSGLFAPRNTINCYNLIGDPATNLSMPNKPEFDIKQNDFVLSNAFPALGELIKLTITPKNLGIYVDSLRIRFKLYKNNINTQRKDTVIRNFSYIDTLNHFFEIDTIGNYSMSVVLDPNKSYIQKFTNNDSITFQLTLRNLSYVPIKPLNNAQINSTSFKFTGLNPNIDVRNNSVKVILQVDTSRNFNSSTAQTFNNDNIQGVSTSFNVNIPVQTLNTVYFLRTNALINNDSSGWSEVQKVIYNPDISDKDNLIDSVYTIYTIKPQQYEEPNLVDVSYTDSGFVLDKSIGNLIIRSYGSNADQASFFTINGINSFSDGGGNKGLNIAKVKKLTGNANAIRNFRMTSALSSDSVVDFLNTFDSTDYIMVYMTGDLVGSSFECLSDSLRQNVKSKLRSFGSVYADSVYTFCRFTTWAFFGFLGANTSQTCEGYHDFFSNNNWEPQNCQINPTFQKTSGSISQTFGPAARWKTFSWEQTLFPNSLISMDIFGINRDNIPVTLSSNLTNNSNINLDTVDYFTYPSLKLDVKLSIDTILGLNSPIFKSLNFKYIPPAELVPDNYSFAGGDSIVQEGDSLFFQIKYYNVGFRDAQVYMNKWYAKKQGLEFVLKIDTINSPLKVDSMKISEVNFSTSGLRDPKIEQDTVDLYFETSLIGNENEIYSFNNIAVTKFIVEGDTLRPIIEVTYDGAKIQNGDFVSSKPDIKLQFFDDSRMIINDTSNIKVYLDNKYVPYYVNGVKNPEIDLNFPDDRFLQATLTYRPVLQAGEHKFRYVATDITGNISDSIVNWVIVENNLKIFDMANYPNPMKTETNFMFRLSGELNPRTCKVKIYTVAGRLVKEINASAIVGHNNIYWDGKDDDGDYIANGTYLYKFIIQGNTAVETTIQKLAVLR